ncbi:MAG: type II toxin-antitoxin system mRNA interferase toxin, RelE/StbE family [Minisyncoccota bacterium]
MEILYSPRFARRYKKLSASVKSSAERRESLFRKDWKDPVLNTHKLNGRLDGLWAFSIDNRHRIIFEFISPKQVIFHTVGNHGVYD